MTPLSAWDRACWVRDAVGVIGPARAVLWALAVAHANDKGLAWPGVVTLARESGLSRWTVGRALDDLLAIGAMEIVERKHRKATTYRVRFDLNPSMFGSRQPPTEHEAPGPVGSTQLPNQHEAPAMLVAECSRLVAESGAERFRTEGGESLDVNGETARREAGGDWAVGPYRLPARSFRR